MSKFTGGEWVADDRGEYVFIRIPEGLDPLVQIRGWSYLTDAANGLGLTPEEAIEVQKANARLIAAAPKMYERLKLLARLISRQAQNQLNRKIDPAITNSIYELLAEIDNEPAETMKYSSSFFQNRNCEYFPCHQVEDTEHFSCLFCFCPLYHMKKCGGKYRTLSNGVKACSGCTLPHRNYNRVISILKEEAKDVQ